MGVVIHGSSLKGEKWKAKDGCQPGFAECCFSLLFHQFFILFFGLLTKIIGDSIVGAVTKFQDGLLVFFKYLNKEASDVKLLDESNNDEIANMAKEVNNNIRVIEKNIDEDKKFLNDIGYIELED